MDKKLEIIVKALDEKFGKDIVAIDMKESSALFDTFVICSTDNERTLEAICDNVEDLMFKAGYKPRKIEGAKSSKWVLMDYGDIIVHVFDKDARNNYNLEKLWSDMPLINIEGII
ncbi:MAG: ribosome silencing factor [Thomasclavelia sp.]|nr:ribosome silencing factor [Thomasclavelia sp.]